MSSRFEAGFGLAGGGEAADGVQAVADLSPDCREQHFQNRGVDTR